MYPVGTQEHDNTWRLGLIAGLVGLLIAAALALVFYRLYQLFKKWRASRPVKPSPKDALSASTVQKQNSADTGKGKGKSKESNPTETSRPMNTNATAETQA